MSETTVVLAALALLLGVTLAYAATVEVRYQKRGMRGLGRLWVWSVAILTLVVGGVLAWPGTDIPGPLATASASRAAALLEAVLLSAAFAVSFTSVVCLSAPLLEAAGVGTKTRLVVMTVVGVAGLAFGALVAGIVGVSTL